jgi:uncharacterized protein YndB with AHSA1/START domain
MTTEQATRREFTLMWSLDATPAQVFRAWTDPAHLEWYYNDQQPIPDMAIELDLRVGGVWRQLMVIDETTAFVTGGVYREIVPDERLVFAWGATDGWPELDPARLDESPLVTVLLSQVDGRTEMSLTVALPASLAEEHVREWWALGVREGWRATVDRLAAVYAAAPASP